MRFQLSLRLILEIVVCRDCHVNDMMKRSFNSRIRFMKQLSGFVKNSADILGSSMNPNGREIGLNDSSVARKRFTRESRNSTARQHDLVNANVNRRLDVYLRTLKRNICDHVTMERRLGEVSQATRRLHGNRLSYEKDK